MTQNFEESSCSKHATRSLQLDTDEEESNICISKQRHSLIEKRRRKKMNTYIMELSVLLPMATSGPKVDKITILRKAVQHMKNTQGSSNIFCKSNRPPFISDEEMKCLIERMTSKLNSKTFFFAISCSRGEFLHVSDSMSVALGMNENEWHGLSIFDLLHCKDVAKVKEQLSYSLHEPMFESKYSQISSSKDLGISSGFWRSFLCRLKGKCKSQPLNRTFTSKEDIHVDGIFVDNDAGLQDESLLQNSERSFLTMQCNGFIKHCHEFVENSNANYDDPKQNYLIVVANPKKPLLHTKITRAACLYNSILETDGKIIRIDQTVTGILGYLPQELVGTSVYEYYHHEDLQAMGIIQQKVLQTTNHVQSPKHRFRAKSGRYVTLQSDMMKFINPLTRITDCIVCTSKVISFENMMVPTPPSLVSGTFNRCSGTGNTGMLIANKVLQQVNRDESFFDILTNEELSGSESSVDSFSSSSYASTHVKKYESIGNSPPYLYPTPQPSPDFIRTTEIHTSKTKVNQMSGEGWFSSSVNRLTPPATSHSESAMTNVMSSQSETNAFSQVDFGDFAWAL